MAKTTTHFWLALKLVPRLAIHKKLALVKEYGLPALFTSKGKPSLVTSSNGLSAKQLKREVEVHALGKRITLAVMLICCWQDVIASSFAVPLLFRVLSGVLDKV